MFHGFHRIPFFIKYWDQSHLSHTWVLRFFYVFKQVEPRFEISFKLHDACISSIQKMLTHSIVGSQAVDFQPAVAIYLEVRRRSLGRKNMLRGLRPVVFCGIKIVVNTQVQWYTGYIAIPNFWSNLYSYIASYCWLWLCVLFCIPFYPYCIPIISQYVNAFIWQPAKTWQVFTTEGCVHCWLLLESLPFPLYTFEYLHLWIIPTIYDYHILYYYHLFLAISMVIAAALCLFHLGAEWAGLP